MAILETGSIYPNTEDALGPQGICRDPWDSEEGLLEKLEAKSPSYKEKVMANG